VRAGETVASLALRYGYTESRFREFNNLGPNEYIRVGQRLRTDHCEPAPASTPVSTTTEELTPRSPVTTPAPSPYSGIPNQLSATPAPSRQDQLVARSPNAPASYDQPMMSEVAGNRINTQATVSDQLQARSPAAGSQPASRNVSPNDIYNAIIPKGYDDNRPASMSTVENRAISPRTPASYTAPVARGGTPSSYDYPAGGQQELSNTLPSRPDSYYRQSSNQRRVHIVQEGETLYTIAREYRTTPDQLQKINNLEPNAVILPYQTLYIE
jgi:LysM repeat protein